MNKNVLNSVPIDRQKTNIFDLSHDLKFSFNMGYIIPTTIVDCVPGDNFTIGFENMLRFSALIAPVMHRVKISTHYFFVPNRIVWDGWEKWITGESEVEPPYFVPKTPFSDDKYRVDKGSLCDYMGVPPCDIQALTEDPENSKINALPFAAYWKIYHEYYMDQNNDGSFETFPDMFNLTDGDNSANAAGDVWFSNLAFACGHRIGDRAWSHDYFTSALPWAQKGEDVFIPLTAPVITPFTDGEDFPRRPLIVRELASATSVANQDLTTGAQAGVMAGPGGVWFDGQIAENTEGEGTINNLRRAFALQSWLEKNARGGTRYTESILAHFGVRSSDSRLQRPEYLGGSVQNMVISEVLSTAQTLNSADDVVNPVGQLSGHGISVGGSRVLNYFCEEHGWIIGMISVMPDTAYQNGLALKFQKNDRFQYFWPSFQHIGEQAINHAEIQFDPVLEPEFQRESTFGYVPRYTEYKFENSRVAGDFRDTLDFWHFGRIFPVVPGSTILAQLNFAFIYPSRSSELYEEVPFDRCFAVSSTVADTIYAHVLNKIKARRPMARYGIPSI